MKKPNFKKITRHCYAVKNQNGFNNSLYDYFGIDLGETSYSKERIRKMVYKFPTKYPTTIIIVDMSFECSCIYIEHFDMDDVWHSLADILIK